MRLECSKQNRTATSTGFWNPNSCSHVEIMNHYVKPLNDKDTRLWLQIKQGIQLQELIELIASSIKSQATLFSPIIFQVKVTLGFTRMPIKGVFVRQQMCSGKVATQDSIDIRNTENLNIIRNEENFWLNGLHRSRIYQSNRMKSKNILKLRHVVLLWLTVINDYYRILRLSFR